MDSNKKFSMEEIIRNSEEITMDTASLMEIDSLKRMVDKYREEMDDERVEASVNEMLKEYVW